jgi:glutamate synthase domain-containing protein 2
MGHHGPMDAMGVPRHELPHWDDLQMMVAQMATKPLFDDQTVGTELIIGPESRKPLELKIPLFVSDMSFGALSEEAKTAMAKGGVSGYRDLFRRRRHVTGRTTGQQPILL